MESELVTWTEKVKKADELLSELSNLEDIRGILKLRKQVIAERAFLVKVASSDVKNSKPGAIQSNLTHFVALVSSILEANDCLAVLETFLFKDGNEVKRLVVDIVAKNGQEWIKVIARNPKGLLQSCMGDTHYGNRTIFDQVTDFKQCASQNTVLYSSPKITFKFTSGIDATLADKLSSHGITVKGELLKSLPHLSDSDTSDTSFDSDESDGEESESSETFLNMSERNPNIEVGPTPPEKKLNLDITALIAYVSEMTNGGSCHLFHQEPLTLQAHAEQAVKIKETLDQLFEGKELYSCETAVKRFLEILETVGGDKEKERAEELLKKIAIIPDNTSERVKALKIGGQIKERARIVFGTGDSIQAVTVSANSGFCRAANHQGVHLSAFVHEPRALSERASIISQSHKSEG